MIKTRDDIIIKASENSKDEIKIDIKESNDIQKDINEYSHDGNAARSRSLSSHSSYSKHKQPRFSESHYKPTMTSYIES